MIHKWFYKFVRRRTKPVPEDMAFIWKRRLSVAYGFFAWNAFGYVCYMLYKGKGDWAYYHGLKSEEERAMPPGRAYAKLLGIKNAEVYRFSGLHKVENYQIVDGEMKSDVIKKEEILDKELLKD